MHSCILLKSSCYASITWEMLLKTFHTNTDKNEKLPRDFDSDNFCWIATELKTCCIWVKCGLEKGMIMSWENLRTLLLNHALRNNISRSTSGNGIWTSARRWWIRRSSALSLHQRVLKSAAWTEFRETLQVKLFLSSWMVNLKRYCIERDSGSFWFAENCNEGSASLAGGQWLVAGDRFVIVNSDFWALGSTLSVRCYAYTKEAQYFYKVR